GHVGSRKIHLVPLRIVRAVQRDALAITSLVDLELVGYRHVGRSFSGLQLRVSVLRVGVLLLGIRYVRRHGRQNRRNLGAVPLRACRRTTVYALHVELLCIYGLGGSYSSGSVVVHPPLRDACRRLGTGLRRRRRV